MTWILEILFGPPVPENPNFEVILDITSLIPWWYPHFVMGCMLLFVILLWAGYHRKSAVAAGATAERSTRGGTHRYDH